MRTKPLLTFLSFMIMTTFFTTSSCKKDNKDEQTIQVSGIEFSPNVFLENGGVVGIDSDIALSAMEKAGIKTELNIANSWDEAYNALLNGSNRALLTVGYSAERKDLFKWAGPTSQGMYGIFEKGNSGLVYPLSIEASKELESIAVVRDWLETTTLEEFGFQNLVYYNTYNEAITAFMNGDIRFIASDFFHLTKTLPSGYYFQNVKAVTRYRTVFYYIAFSKDVSDENVEKVQQAIEKMIEDKTTATIMKQYLPLMPEDYIPGTIQLFTESAPPYNYGTGQDTIRKVEGSSVEIVNEIQARTGFVNKINLSTWDDAYTPPQYLPNSAVLTTARTPERENMFQWVGPIASHRTYFYTRSNEGYTIETLGQAKVLQSIATPKGWYTHDFLINNDFQNIVVTALTSQEVFDQLMNGEVEAVLLDIGDVRWLAEKNDVSMSELSQHMEAMNFNGYIAFSLNTPASTVQQWQNNLDAMKSDGTFETIWNKWFEGIPMP